MSSDRLDHPQHYFSAQPDVASAPREIRVSLRGHTLTLLTDRGIFSYGEVDRGTRLLAQQMQIPSGAEVLDWGAGYGVLGIIAALLCPSCQVTMVEVNERAAQLAHQNAELAGAANVTVIAGEAPEALGSSRFDVIISNPPFRAGRQAVEAFIVDAAHRLTAGGQLWLVVPTNKGAKTFFKMMADLFAEVDTIAISGGYRVLWGQKSASDDLT